MRKALLVILIIIFIQVIFPLKSLAAAPYAAINGVIDFVNGNVSLSSSVDSDSIIIKNGTELVSKNLKTFNVMFNLKEASGFTIAKKNGDSVTLTFTFPEMPSILKSLLPTMNFSFDTKTNEFKFNGKLKRRPTGSLKGSVSNFEGKYNSTFDVAKDGSFSSSIILQEGDNTIRSYVRYMLLVKVSLPGIKMKLGNATVIKLKINDPKMYVNGISKEVDPGRGTTPIIKDGRTLLPIRTVVESLGGTIDWDGTARKVTIKLNGKIIEMWIENSTAKVNDISKLIDPSNKNVKPIIVNGRTMLPVRFVSESLGAYVEWFGDTKEVLMVYVGG